MEPVTHLLTGACLARSGLNRRAAYATLTMVVAAEFPDIDTLWGLRGPVAQFEHHRGITHTFLGLPFEAALIVLAVYGLHRWRTSRAAAFQSVAMENPRSGRTSAGPPSAGAKLPASPGRAFPGPLTAAPVRWGSLYGLALLALLSHLLLDYTNNYGLRPFYPFNPRWYSASIVFIFDPLIFAMLVVGLVAPAIFGLVNAEVGVRRQPFRGRGWANAALLGVVALWTLREVEHTRATQLAMSQSIVAPSREAANVSVESDGSAQGSANGAAAPVQPRDDAGPAPPSPAVTYLSARRVLANPDPLSPFQWSAVIDFGPVYQLAEIDTRNSAVSPSDTFEPKPPRSPTVLAAEASPLGRFYTKWSPMPFVDVSFPDSSGLDSSGGTAGKMDDSALTVVTFRDPRFMGPIPLLSEAGTADSRSRLSATVTLNPAGGVVRQSMGAGGGR